MAILSFFIVLAIVHVNVCEFEPLSIGRLFPETDGAVVTCREETVSCRDGQ